MERNDTYLDFAIWVINGFKILRWDVFNGSVSGWQRGLVFVIDDTISLFLILGYCCYDFCLLFGSFDCNWESVVERSECHLNSDYTLFLWVFGGDETDLWNGFGVLGHYKKERFWQRSVLNFWKSRKMIRDNERRDFCNGHFFIFGISWQGILNWKSQGGTI